MSHLMGKGSMRTIFSGRSIRRIPKRIPLFVRGPSASLVQDDGWDVVRIPRRCKVSAVQEPPLNAGVDRGILEKPCTLILLEDEWRYEKSWRPYFESNVPIHHGMSYATLTLGQQDKDEPPPPQQQELWNKRMEEIKEDLSMVHHDAVLVARGPLASWTAFFYLESFPLTGLVCVDPIQWDDDDSTTTLPHHEEEEEEEGGRTTVGGSSTSRRRRPRSSSWSVDHYASQDPVTSRLIREASTKTLKLEPNALPMLILHSSMGGQGGGIGGQQNDDDDYFYSRKQCEIVASRHGDPEGPFGEVEVREFGGSDDPKLALHEIDQWIESIL